MPIRCSYHQSLLYINFRFKLKKKPRIIFTVDIQVYFTAIKTALTNRNARADWPNLPSRVSYETRVRKSTLILGYYE